MAELPTLAPNDTRRKHPVGIDAQDDLIVIVGVLRNPDLGAAGRDVQDFAGVITLAGADPRRNVDGTARVPLPFGRFDHIHIALGRHLRPRKNAAHRPFGARLGSRWLILCH